MALFYSRRSSSRRRSRSRSRRDEPYSMSHRPTFGRWLKHSWKDIATMVVLGALGLGIYMLPPAPSRSFPVTFSDGEIVYPEFAYPLRKEIIPIWLAALLAALIPIFAMLSLNIAHIRSFWDANNSIMGLLYSLITAAVFQVILKWLIGGLRPHFLDVCKPDISLATNGANGVGGFKQIYYTKDICTGDKREVNDSLESFPSGHTTAAFAGFIYLSLYVNAKLKVFADTHTNMWKLSAVWAPVLGAVLIGGALTIDEFHNWYDVFAGAVIGTCMAISSYRMVYAAVWDWRWNHVPLHRGVSLAWTGREEEEWGYAVATRKGRWQECGRHSVWSEKRRYTSSGGRSPYRGSNVGVTYPGQAVGSRSPRRGDNMV